MKQLILSVAVVTAIVFTSCTKTNVTPIGTSNTDKQAPTLLADNSNAKQIGGGSRGEPNLNGGPEDPGCLPGRASCVEVVVNPTYRQNLINALNSGEISTFLNPENIKILSNGDSYVADILNEVINGNENMIQVAMPNAQGTKAAFIIGHTGNMPTSNFVGSIILKNN